MQNIQCHIDTETLIQVFKNMNPKWCNANNLPLVKALFRYLHNEDNLINACQALSIGIIRYYVNPVMNANKRIEIVNCTYDPEQRKITISIPLDLNEENFLRIGITIITDSLALFVEINYPTVNYPNIAKIAAYMVFNSDKAEQMMWLDNMNMKWRHALTLSMMAYSGLGYLPCLDQINETGEMSGHY